MIEDDDLYDENPPGVPPDDDAEAVIASIEDDVLSDPREGLPELLRVIEDELGEAGFLLRDPVSAEGLDPEVQASLEQARETVQLLEADAPVDLQTVRQAVANLLGLRSLVRPGGMREDDLGALSVDPAVADQIDMEAEAGEIGETEVDR